MPYSFLPRLEIHIAEHCNLNCQSCTHFSPIAEPEFLPVDEFEKDIKRMSELTDRIDDIHILGGEPLLNPDCIKYLEIAREYFPKSNIKLVTNGILLPSMTDFFYESLAKFNIILAPTKYPIKINWDKVQKKCKQFSVNLEFFNDSKVIKTSYKLTLDTKGTQNEKISFIKCSHANSCIQLKKGKIYTCCTAAYINHFNKYFKTNLCDDEYNGINIYKVNNIQEILEFIAHPIPLCKYCNVYKHLYGLKWKTSNKNIEEWI